MSEPTDEEIQERFGLINEAEVRVTKQRSADEGISLAEAARSLRAERTGPYNMDEYTPPPVLDDGETRPENPEPEVVEDLDGGDFVALVEASGDDSDAEPEPEEPKKGKR